MNGGYSDVSSLTVAGPADGSNSAGTNTLAEGLGQVGAAQHHLCEHDVNEDEDVLLEGHKNKGGRERWRGFGEDDELFSTQSPRPSLRNIVLRRRPSVMEEDSDTPDETPMLDDDSSNGHPSLHCDEWDQKVNARVSRSYLDRLVMNYLVIEGYKEVAECFQKESSISPTVDLRTIESRMDVRAAVMEGDMQRAIAQLNQHDPQVLQRHRGLYFTLQLQHLVELIRADRVNDALSFARTELAALGEESKENLRRLEEAMTLLLFRDKSKCPLSGLLDMAHRSRAADQANAAMLNSVSQTTEPVLPRLVRLLVHSQRELKRKAEFPAVPWFDD